MNPAQTTATSWASLYTMNDTAIERTNSTLSMPRAAKYRASGVPGTLVSPPTTPATNPSGGEIPRSHSGRTRSRTPAAVKAT